MVGTNTGSLLDQWRTHGTLGRAERGAGGMWEPSGTDDQARREDLLESQSRWCWMRLGNSWELLRRKTWVSINSIN